MSRRSRKKFKKMLRAQMAAQRTAAPSEVSQVSQPEAGGPQTPAATPASEDTITVRREIRKTLLTILVLVAIILAVYFVNLKTDFILKIGEFLSSNLNINV